MSASLSGGQEDGHDAPQPTLAVAVWPGIEPRLLRPSRRRGLRRLPRRRAATSRSTMPTRLLEQVDLSGLLGRGGAAFPLAVKLQTVRDNGRTGRRRGRGRQRRRGRTRVDQGPVAAAAPSASGARRAAAGRRGWSAPSARMSTSPIRGAAAAVADRARRARPETSSAALSISVLTVDPGYVAGEETAAVRAHQRRPGQTDRQAAAPVRRGRRRPADDGQQCRDARANSRSSTGTAPRRSAQQGTSTSPGTFLATITGAGRPPALYEIPHGVAFTELLDIARRARRSGARRADGRLLRRPAEPRRSRHHARPRDRCVASAAGWAAARSRSSPTTARSPSRHR